MIKKDLSISLVMKMLKKIRPLCIFLPKMSAHRKDYNETKYVSFLIKDNEIFKKWNKIFDKVSYSITKEFDSNQVYNKICLWTKIRSYKGKINTTFHNKKISQEGSPFICISVILIDSVFRAGKNYYPLILTKTILTKKLCGKKF